MKGYPKGALCHCATKNDVSHCQESASTLMQMKLGSFTYQSWRHELSYRFEGFLLYVPGSLYNEEAGEPFHVRVAPFHLNSNPGYFY
jgi:hypothetical protein